MGCCTRARPQGRPGATAVSSKSALNEQHDFSADRDAMELLRLLRTGCRTPDAARGNG